MWRWVKPGAGIMSMYGICRYSCDPGEAATTRIVEPWSTTKKKALVVGAGVAGVSTAWSLMKRGYEVVVVDGEPEAGKGCSQYAAGGLQRSTNVINRETWMKVMENILFSWRSSEVFRYFYMDWWDCLTDPHFLRWMTWFTYSGLLEPDVEKLRQQHMLQFSSWGIDQLEAVIREDEAQFEAVHFDHRGALVLNVMKQSDSLEPTTCLNDPKAVTACEPLVDRFQRWKQQPLKSMYNYDAASGNSEIFTKKLAEKLARSNQVTFQYETKVQHFQTQDNRITGINTTKGLIPISPDTQVVFAAGAWTPQLLWQLGLFTPIYPLKGYCCRLNETPNFHGIVNVGPVYICPLGNQLRIASIGEFSGWKSTPTPKVRSSFQKEIEQYGISVSEDSIGCGLRPLSADGGVIVGAVDGWKNVQVIVGPGFTGWANAVGCAELLARSMENHPIPDIKFNPDYLSPKDRIVKAPFWSKLCLARHN